MGLCEGIGKAVTAICCGIILWPLALLFSGWNEQQTVCREKALFSAERLSKAVKCDSRAGVSSTDLGLLQCGIDSSTFKDFTKADFAGVTALNPLFAGNSSSVKAAKVVMTVSTYVCEEFCAEQVCDRRLQEEVPHKDDKDEAAHRPSEDVDESRSLLSSRKGAQDDENKEIFGRRLKKKEKSCTNRCVRYDYRLQRSSSAITGSSSFHDHARAQQQCCRTGGNCLTPASSPVMIGDSSVLASGGEVKVTGGAWGLNEYQLAHLPIDAEVALANRNPITFSQSSAQPPSRLTVANTKVSGNTIYTCNENSVGCLEISFKKSAPVDVIMLGVPKPELGIFGNPEKGEIWKSPPAWLCKPQEVSETCPQTNALALSGGDTSCPSGLSTEEFFETMQSANSTITWIYRAAGYLGCLIAVCCLCAPIKQFLEFVTDKIDDFTECIPCIGCIVDLMTDIFMFMVDLILNVIICWCATASFLIIAGAVWVAMRPQFAIPCLVVAACCCFGACGLAYSQKISPEEREEKMQEAKQAREANIEQGEVLSTEESE